jgi:anaerobic magnesium-protoporphyrin IX monomethyl ester cyclase
MMEMRPLENVDAKYDDVEAQKRLIVKAIKPVSGITSLPPLLTAPKRILLVVPPGTMEEHVGRLSGAAGELPMLGLAFIAAALRDQGHEIKIIDYEVNGWPMSRVAGDISDFKPDAVCMTGYITNMRRCASVALISKQVDPKTTVIMGGPQVTIFPEEAFHSPDIDVVVLSEGEIIVRNLMNALGDEDKLTDVKGIWFRRVDGEIQQNEREVLVDNLDIFPAPALDLFDLELYFPPVYIRGKKVAHMLTTRGCPFQCTFCETKLTFGRSLRFHSIERIVDEIEQLINKGYDGIQFYDDIFTANARRTTELCEEILERGLKFSWMCYTRTNTVSLELLTLMRRAGCYLISYGIETGDDELLDIVKKNLDVEANRRGIALANEAGIEVAGTFMLGLPTETAEQTQRTIEFALNNPIDYAIFGILEPYPGTEMWLDTKRYGTFDDTGKYQNNLLSENAAVWVPHGRTREELKDAVEQAMQRFYLRPSALYRAVRNFWLLPPKRAFRYLWAGWTFFVLGRFRKSRLAHMGTRN